MEARLITLYQIRVRGVDGIRVVEYTTGLAEAEKESRQYSCIGGHFVQTKGVVLSDGSIYALGERLDTKWNKAKIRADALKKLTTEERDALGIKDE